MKAPIVTMTAAKTTSVCQLYRRNTVDSGASFFFVLLDQDIKLREKTLEKIQAENINTSIWKSAHFKNKQLDNLIDFKKSLK